MGRTVLVTGSASGIGAATVARLRRLGHRAIGVDRHHADIEADLSSVDGRARLVEQAVRLTSDGLDGVVACAGTGGDPGLTVSVNYFGAVATVAGLRPLLRRSPTPRAVVIGSSTAILPHSAAIVAACLAGDEAGARAAAQADPDAAYISSKAALARWVRREAPGLDWAGAGILLNGVNPGMVKTPISERFLSTERGRAAIRQWAPIAVADYGEPEALAETICFLATLEGSYLLGQILFVDGGSDALIRPDSF